jgi:exosortase C (VPDSG-CTERM-specific)
LPRSKRTRITALIGWVVAATLVFIQPLVALVRHAAQSDLLSYIPLVPVVAGYLLFIRRRSGETPYRSSIAGTITLVGVGSVAGVAATFWRDSLSLNDSLALMALAYVGVVAAGGFLFLGAKWMASAAFPVAFLVFLTPLPDATVHWLQTASVMASADAADWLFIVTGTPVVRDNQVFMLPSIVLEVAQECSGIHSTWVLFITSLVASNLFLESPWRRVALVAFVIPLAIARNAFRILTIGLLCVHVGPHMIDSIIHRRGGPFFFLLSLGPLFLFLAWLRRHER